MDWEKNLAAVIRCTDASLAQQFRAFEELDGDLHAPPFDPYYASVEPEATATATGGGGGGSSNDNLASAFLRETMAVTPPQPPASAQYTRKEAARGPAPTFSEHFRHRREHKRQSARRRATDNQHHSQYGNEEAGDAGGEDPPERPTARAPAGIGYHMYASPAYDVAQMMEQIRLSLKLEVDARAAIAERQLSALLQLSKSTAEELDRMRVEVCANDRQLHTLDQVQSKLRTELTTQKDIGFHLQSLCGKDEAWRMQAENQLLELRQVVAAIREQGNAVQAATQDKLSRGELQVHFNASMEPIKAQLQTMIQHQAHQMAEATRTASSTSLLLDGLTQKVNHGIAGELADLKNDVTALKTQVSKLFSEAFSQPRDVQPLVQLPSKEEMAATAAVERAERDKQLKEAVDAMKKTILEEVTALVAVEIKTVQQHNQESVAGLARRTDVESQMQRAEESWRSQQSAAIAQTEKMLKAMESQLHSEFGNGLRELRSQIEQAKQSATEVAKTADTRATSLENKCESLAKKLEKEQENRRQALDKSHETLRGIRAEVESSIYQFGQEARSKQLQYEQEAERRIKESERRVDDVNEKTSKELRAKVLELEAAWKVVEERISAKSEPRLKLLEESLAKVNAAVTDLAARVGGDVKPSPLQSEREDIRATLDKQTNAFVSAIDASMQRVQLQLQLQLQAQSHAAMTAPASSFPAYPGYWMAQPSSRSSLVSPPTEPVAPPPIAPLLSLPPSVTSEAAKASADKIVQDPASRELANTKSQPTGTPLNDHRLIEVPSRTVSDDQPPVEPSDISTERRAASEDKLPAAAALSPPERASVADKVQDTISTSARGAIMEAELARARVESRRKQEQELRQHQQQQQHQQHQQQRDPLSPMTSTEKSARQDSDSRPAPPAHPLLARASSASSISVNSVRSADAINDEATLLHTRSNSMVNIGKPTAVPAHPRGGLPATANTNLPSHSSPPTVVTQPKAVQLSNSERAAIPVSPSLPSVQISEPKRDDETPRAASAATLANVPFAGDSMATNNAGRPKFPLTKQSTPLSSFTTSSPSEPTSAFTAASGMQYSHAQANTSNASAPSPAPPSPSSIMMKLFGRPAPPAAAKSNEDDTALSSGGVSRPVPTQPSSVAKPPSMASTTVVAAPAGNVPAPSTTSHILCSLCRLPIRADSKDEHEKHHCPRRLVECSMCNVKVLWINLDVHAKTCSSQPTSAVDKSESTPTNVPPTQNEISSATDEIKKCRHCALDVPATELLDHEMRCDKVLKQCPHCLRRQKMSELQEHIENCDCRLVSCPNDCGGKFLQRGIAKHLATRCPKKPADEASAAGSTSDPTPTQLESPRPSTPQLVSSTTSNLVDAPQSKPMSAQSVPQVAPPTPIASTSRNPSVTNTAATVPSTTHPAPAAKTECKFCDEEFPGSAIEQHEQDCDWRPKRCQHCNMVIISRDLVRHETSCKTSFKTCQHCDESMPQSALSAHTARCSKRPIKCIRCCQLFPADVIVAHSTSCRFVPGTTPGTVPPAPNQPPPPGAPPSNLRLSAGATVPPPPASPAIRVPPPPPYPPTGSGTSQPIPPQRSSVTPDTGALAFDTNDAARMRANSASVATLGGSSVSGDDTAAARLARRSLALSQLTNSGGSAPSTPPSAALTSRAPMIPPSRPGSIASTMHPEVDDDDNDEAEHDNDEDDEIDEDDDGDGEEMTLAQVVAEWSVENVCVWLKEDVGVGEVVPKFEQRRCNGAMLLELTESDLVNDLGIRNRIHRERILNAIEAVKMSDDMSENDEDDDDYDDEDDDDEDDEGENDDQNDEDDGGTLAPRTQPLNRGSISSMGGLSYPNAQTSMHRQAGEALPSSNAMFRRINNALELPKK